MIDLIDPNNIDDDVPDFDTTRPSDMVHKETAAEALASLALDAALTPQSRKILKQTPRVFILKVPHSSWMEVFVPLIKQMERTPYISLAVERRRAGGSLQPVGADHLRYLLQGRSILYISPDPDGILDAAVLAAADVTIVSPDVTSTLLRQVIRRVSGGVARGVTEAMAALELPVILSVVRSDLTAGECVAKLRDAVARTRKPTATTVPQLVDLPLTDPIRKWTGQTLADLGAVKDGSMPAGQLVFAMLEGPPGTGKTLIAESLARSAGWTFVPATVGGWFASGDGALGGIARNIRAFVDLVIASEPAIGFLDEVDAIPSRATMDNRGRDWWTPVVNLFLTEVDRLRKSGKRVMLLGATNYYHHLDAALIRPGRMQQRVSVLPPRTEAEVLALLKFYLKGELTDADLGKLARLGLGATPATVEGWVKEGRGTARAATRALATTDLLEQMLPRDDRSPEDLRIVALHEIGHAIVAHRLGFAVDRVSIVAEGNSGGHTTTKQSTIAPTWERLCDQVTLMLGGRAADMVLGAGANVGAESDLAHATATLLAAFERQGLCDDLTYMPHMGTRSLEVKAGVKTELNRSLKHAMEIVKADRNLALDLAEQLITERVLSGRDISGKLGERPTPPPTRHEPRTRRIRAPLDEATASRTRS